MSAMVGVLEFLINFDRYAWAVSDENRLPGFVARHYEARCFIVNPATERLTSKVRDLSGSFIAIF
jgi:hypothetical protein